MCHSPLYSFLLDQLALQQRAGTSDSASVSSVSILSPVSSAASPPAPTRPSSYPVSETLSVVAVFSSSSRSANEASCHFTIAERRLANMLFIKTIHNINIVSRDGNAWIETEVAFHWAIF